jgi:hypothetical protein
MSMIINPFRFATPPPPVGEGFDYYRRGEPVRVLRTSAITGGFDYFRRGEPIAGLR